MDLDRAHLTPTQKNLANAWEQLFASDGWEYLQRRFRPIYEASISELEDAEDMKRLGEVVGSRRTLWTILDLEASIESEFRNEVSVAQAERAGEDETEWRG